MWDYAKLTQDAKSAGGPDEFCNELFEAGKETANAESLPIKIGLGVFGIIIGVATTLGIINIKDDKKKNANEKKEKAERKLKDFMNAEKINISEDSIESVAETYNKKIKDTYKNWKIYGKDNGSIEAIKGDKILEAEDLESVYKMIDNNEE